MNKIDANEIKTLCNMGLSPMFFLKSRTLLEIAEAIYDLGKEHGRMEMGEKICLLIGAKRD